VTTHEQTMTALEFANEVRSARAKVLRAIREGRRRADRVINNPPTLCGGMQVSKVLKAQPRWGPTKARSTLYMTRTRADATLGELSVRQRQEITQRLNGNG
jgi:hypothetical protein